MTFNVLDLFSGIGGFALGLEQAGGFRTVAFCEQEPSCRTVLNHHWPDVPVFPDVRALTKESINERIDVITGGFPCQDLSTAGRGAGLAGPRSGLWFEFLRLIEAFKPTYVLIENVSALRSRGLEVVLGGLASLGYDAEWHCIPASAVGAPHTRDRVWIVAYPERLRPPGPGRYLNALHPAPHEYREASGIVDAFQGNALPFLCRGHDGFPRGVGQDALKQLGNSVTPIIPRMIGEAINASTRETVN